MTEIWSCYPTISVINRTRAPISLAPQWTFDKGDPVSVSISIPAQKSYSLSGGSPADLRYPYPTTPTVDDDAEKLVSFMLGSITFSPDLNSAGKNNSINSANSLVIVIGETVGTDWNYNTNPYDGAVFYLVPSGTDIYRYVQGADNNSAAIGIAPFLTSVAGCGNCVYYVGKPVPSIDADNAYNSDGSPVFVPTDASIIDFGDADMEAWLASI